jgi:hypothetical protein
MLNKNGKNCRLWYWLGFGRAIAHSKELAELSTNMKKFLCGNDFWPRYGHMKIEKVKGPPFGSKTFKNFFR